MDSKVGNFIFRNDCYLKRSNNKIGKKARPQYSYKRIARRKCYTCCGWEIVVFFFQRQFIIDYGGERCCKIPFLWAPILSCIVIKYHQNIESITGYGSLNTLKVSLLFVIRGSEISASHFFHLQLKMCRSY